jgi:DNA-binding GntR family transcriptional regulator
MWVKNLEILFRRDALSTGEPVYKSLARSIREAIESGTALHREARCQQLRQLAEQQGTSTATVLRAYAYLTSLGYLQTLPKEGTFVAVPMTRPSASNNG